MCSHQRINISVSVSVVFWDFLFNFGFDQWSKNCLPLEPYLKIFVWVEKDITYQNMEWNRKIVAVAAKEPR